MKTIKTLVTELVECISSRKHVEIDFQYLEDKYTSPIISSDEYEKLPDEVQDAVELLDTWDIQELRQSDINEIVYILRLWLEGDTKNVKKVIL